MIRELSVRNILLIEALDLDFHAGLNVLTGETGAGKSILLDCLGFVLGWRGRADVVRSGASSGEVTAIFELPLDHPARAILAEAEIPINEEVILRRVSSGGRKKAFVNDRRVTPDVLHQLSDTLLEIHGQQDDKGLLDARAHRDLLDSFAGVTAELAQVKARWAGVRVAKEALAAAREALENAARDAEFLEHSVAELTAISPEAGEDARLDSERRLMQAAERIRADIGNAGSAIGPTGAQAQVADALRWLEDVAPEAEGRLDGAIEALGHAFNELADAERGVQGTLDALSHDPAHLEAVEERLFALRGLARKHNVHVDELPELLADMARRHEAISQGDAHIGKLEAELTTAQNDFDKAATVLLARRVKAASALDRAVAAELAPLKMERAVFRTVLERAEPGPSGVDAVHFAVATNPGAPAGPLAKIASGGELSRFLLALKVCLKGADAKTMIFDEIDRGVGGATADAVGKRLADLSDDGQVIVVTHSPQVAARAAHHMQVAKTVRKGTTHSDVVVLDETARIEEVARMLAGETITDAAKSAARELLAG